MNNIISKIENFMKSYMKTNNVITTTGKYMTYDSRKCLRLNCIINYTNIYLFQLLINKNTDVIYGIEYEKYWIDDFDNVINKQSKDKHLNEFDMELSKLLIGSECLEN